MPSNQYTHAGLSFCPVGDVPRRAAAGDLLRGEFGRLPLLLLLPFGEGVLVRGLGSFPFPFDFPLSLPFSFSLALTFTFSFAFCFTLSNSFC